MEHFNIEKVLNVLKATKRNRILLKKILESIFK